MLRPVWCGWLLSRGGEEVPEGAARLMPHRHKAGRVSWTYRTQALCDDCDWQAGISFNSQAPNLTRKQETARLYSIATRHVARTDHRVEILREHRSIFARADQA